VLDFLLIEPLGGAKNISDVTNDTIKCVSIFN
jgi:phosphotransferase system IIB component